MNQKLAEVSPRFLQQIANAVHYWLGVTQHVDDSKIAALDCERTNIVRVLDYSLKVDSLVCPSAELIRQVFKLIEQKAYWSEWIPILKTALAAIPDDETELKIVLLNQTGFLCRLQHASDEALTYHEQALALCTAAERSDDLTITHYHLANVYFDTGDLQQSLCFAQKAQTGFANYFAADNVKQAAIHNLLGLITLYADEIEEAVPLFQLAIEQWQKTDQKIYLIRTFCNQALALTWLGHYEAALQCYEQALSTLGEDQNWIEVSRIRGGQGTVYFEMQLWSEAEQYFVQAEEISRHYQADDFIHALTTHNLGSVLAKKKQWLIAQSYLEESIIHCRRANAVVLQTLSMGLLGVVLANLAQSEKGVSLLDEALAQLEQLATDRYSKKLHKELEAHRLQL
jgi:tetratricopeptide (TPR) repeat protein